MKNEPFIWVYVEGWLKGRQEHFDKLGEVTDVDKQRHVKDKVGTDYNTVKYIPSFLDLNQVEKGTVYVRTCLWMNTN